MDFLAHVAVAVLTGIALFLTVVLLMMTVFFFVRMISAIGSRKTDWAVSDAWNVAYSVFNAALMGLTAYLLLQIAKRWEIF
jgi:hypothetical protein